MNEHRLFLEASGWPARSISPAVTLCGLGKGLVLVTENKGGHGVLVGRKDAHHSLVKITFLASLQI